MMIDILRCEQKKGFCNLVEGNKKINEQEDFVTETKGVKYTP